MRWLPDGTTRLYTDRHFPTEWQRSESYEADLQTGHEHPLNDVLAELPPDLGLQADRWSRWVREATVLQHGLGKVSRLNAIGRVLHPLAGLEPELPTPAAERAAIIPAMTPAPGPAPVERSGLLTNRKGRRARSRVH